MESGITKNQIVEVLTRSPHGKLEEYLPVGRVAAHQEPEFIAHLIAWNETNGQIRDSKVALPVATLCEPAFGAELEENSYAHLGKRSPRELVQAWHFARDVKPAGHGRKINRLVERYLRARESNPQWFEYTVAAHRASMLALYALSHTKPVGYANDMLFEKRYRVGSLLHAISTLKEMPASEAAGTIMQRKIPFLVAVSALGARSKDVGMVLALIERMSPTDLVTNTKMLERLGVKTNPALRSAFDAGIRRVAASTKATFKTTRAAEQITDDGLREKLRGAQEKQLRALGGVDGDWLVLGDKSQSQSLSIETTKLVAATLAKMVKGKVHLVFFNASPQYVDVTGMSYDQVKHATRNIAAGGGTVIGCGVLYAVERKLNVDGIAIVSDGGDNRPEVFEAAYKMLVKLKDGTEPPVYLYRTQGDPNHFAPFVKSRMAMELGEFDLAGGVDYHSLPNLVATMRTRRYGLIDKIMETPLLTTNEVFKPREGEDHAAAA